VNSGTTDQTDGQSAATATQVAPHDAAESADRFGEQSHRKMAAIYAVVILSGLGLLSLVLRAGSGLQAPEPTGSEPASPRRRSSTPTR
jgi:hypothetical protein